MLTPARAKRLLDHGQTPFLSAEDVAFITGIKRVTLRQWINRGYLKLRFSPKPEKGMGMLFSFDALVEIMAFASLSRLSFPPNRFSGDLAEIMTSGAFNYLQDIAGMRGDYSRLSEIERNYQRYVIVYFDIFKKNLNWNITSTPTPEIESSDESPNFGTFDGAWITLDCHLLMERTIEGFERLKKQQKNTVKELL